MERSDMLDDEIKLANATYMTPLERILKRQLNKSIVQDILGPDTFTLNATLCAEDEFLVSSLQERLKVMIEELKDITSNLCLNEQGINLKMTSQAFFGEGYNEHVDIKEKVDAMFFGGRLLKEGNLRMEDMLLRKQPEYIKIKRDQNTIQDMKVLVNTSAQTSFVCDKNDVVVDEFTENSNIPQSKNGIANEMSTHKSQAISYVEIKSMYSKKNKFFDELKNKFKNLQTQSMPSINIRSELKQQTIPSLNIHPIENKTKIYEFPANNALIESVHQDYENNLPYEEKRDVNFSSVSKEKKLNLDNNLNSTSKDQIKISKKNLKGCYEEAIDYLQSKVLIKNGKNNPKNLKTVHQLTNSKRKRDIKRKYDCTRKFKPTEKASNKKFDSISNYIPYSKLTLGGVKVSQIEKELTLDKKRIDVDITPILNKILNSCDNSQTSGFKSDNEVRKKSSKKKISNSPLTKSDEKLLESVLDLNKKLYHNDHFNINKMREDIDSTQKTQSKYNSDESHSENDNSKNDAKSYEDDFEDESHKSDALVDKSPTQSNNIENLLEKSEKEIITGKKSHYQELQANLKFKAEIDIFEYIHLIETEDIAIQSQNINLLSLKGTQTTPREETTHDPQNIISGKPNKEETVCLDRDILKSLVREECDDIFEKHFNILTKRPNSVHEIEKKLQKTQTSPLHLHSKNIMTSTISSKDQMTNTEIPSLEHLKIEIQPSPLILADESSSSDKSNIDQDQIGITINLSSPRFNLKLPQSSKEIITNLNTANTLSETEVKILTGKNIIGSQWSKNDVEKKPISITDSHNDASQSDLSSLGEVNAIINRRKIFRKNLRQSSSESSVSSYVESCSEQFSDVNVVPVRSEGEVSLGQLH